VLSNNKFKVDSQIVSSQEIELSNFRIDPSRYNEKANSIKRHLNQLPIKIKTIGTLDGFDEIYLPNRFSRVYLDSDSDGAPMLGTSTMFMIRLPINKIYLNSIKDNNSLWIKEGDILLSRSGTVGTSVLCGRSYKNFIASDDCFRVRLDKSIQGYVAAYLISEIGQTLLIKDAHGKVIKHLKDYDIFNLEIPLIDSKDLNEINSIMLKAAEKVDFARDNLLESERLLTDYFNIQQENDSEISKPWLSKSRLTFIESSNQLIVNRLDPHSCDPSYFKIRSKLSKLPHKLLGNISNIWIPGRFKRFKTEEGYGIPLFSAANIMRAKLKPSAYISEIRNSRNIKQCKVTKDTILIPCSGTFGGILGRAVKANAILDKKSITQHVLRIKITDSDFDPDYVLALLGSLTMGYPLITSTRFGKDVPELDSDIIGKIPIPILDEKIQKQFSTPVLKAYNAIDEANLLEEKALSLLYTTLKYTKNQLLG